MSPGSAQGTFARRRPHRRAPICIRPFEPVPLKRGGPMDRYLESPYGLRVDPEPFVWRRSSGRAARNSNIACERSGSSFGPEPMESRDRNRGDADVHELLNAGVPSTRPEIPTTLLVAFSRYEASGWNDATHGTAGNGYTSPPFYELGVFQVPAGLHGRCTDKKCEIDPPGLENASSPSAWSRLCTRLRLDPKNWKDPTTQVRVGLANLENDAQIIRSRYPDLFPRPGTDWDLRGAVLLPFVGIGTANSLIKTPPEASQFLKPIAGVSQFQAIGQQPDARRAARMRDLLNNVEKKMRLHEALTACVVRNPPCSRRAIQKRANRRTVVRPPEPMAISRRRVCEMVARGAQSSPEAEAAVDGNPGSGTSGDPAAAARLVEQARPHRIGGPGPIAHSSRPGRWRRRPSRRREPSASIATPTRGPTCLACRRPPGTAARDVRRRYYSGYRTKDLSRDEALALSKLGSDAWRCGRIRQGRQRLRQRRTHGTRAPTGISGAARAWSVRSTSPSITSRRWRSGRV